jgi:pimeloyl-ACP methyl ester carboxylesterase
MTSDVAWQADRIAAAGVDLARFTTGSIAPGAPALLLLHGLGHWTGAAWDRIVPLLDPAWRIVAIDLPGFGASERPDVRYDLPFFRRVVADVARQSLPPRFALAGHSLGAMIAADFAAAAPESVDALALIAPAGFADVPGLVVRVLGSPLVRGFFLREPPRGFVERTLRQSVADPAHLDPAVVAQAVTYAQDRLLRRAFAGIYGGAMQAMRDLPALHRHFALYHGRTFIAWGSEDRYIPVKALANARRVYPQAEARVFGASGHVVMDDEPEALGAALRAFLAAGSLDHQSPIRS